MSNSSQETPITDIGAAVRQGIALQQAGRIAEAINLYEAVLRHDPNQGDSLYLLGFLRFQTGDYASAVSLLERAAKALGTHAPTFNTLGAALLRLGRFEEAVEQYSKAIRLRPDYADALGNRGHALQSLGHHTESLADYDRAVTLNPNHPELWFYRGKALARLHRPKDALASFDSAIQGKPDYALAHVGRGEALREMKNYRESLDAFETALEHDPDSELLPGQIQHLRMLMCDWENFEKKCSQLVSAINEGRLACDPLTLLSLVDDPAIHRRAAGLVEEKLAVHDRDFAIRTLNTPLRIGYYSADFYDHATTQLIVELIESHDRNAVEAIGFSFNPPEETPIGTRIVSAFDKFIDVSRMSDEDVVTQSRAMNIDIAIDLKGNTMEARPRLFSLGCAPLQIAYLGYPGSFTAGGVDYVLADSVVIPAGEENNWAERIIRLPQCYQPNDSKRPQAAPSADRKDCGLPQDAIVFCNLNNGKKITPHVFAIWMDILRDVESGVLWLLDGGQVTRQNLRKAASAAGIDPGRLVFAPFVSPTAHRARYPLADLFLDTVPYNAHTTASDALWAGVPVLTMTGRSFASRVGASLLTTLGVPELITSTESEYKALAIELAHNAEHRSRLRHKVVSLRDSSPLFKGNALAPYIEAAYRAVADRHSKGLPTCNLNVYADGEVQFES